MSLNRKKQLVQLAEEGGSKYISAIVLGLNDALVELTGALAGFTMALQNNRLIFLAGLTTGIAATLSMAASEFLSQEAGNQNEHPYISGFFTGIAYLITVAILLVPFFFMDNPYHSLACCLFFAGLIILAFTWTTSKIRKTHFLHDFLQMLCISFGVAAIAFGLSWLAKMVWGVTV